MKFREPNAVAKGFKLAMVSAMMVASMSTAQAQISEADIQQFANALSQAANQKNVGRIAQLVDNNVLISLSRNGKTTTLNKDSYLRLLQDNWSKTSNYHYQINISNVIIAGNQAKADIQTIETLTENGKPERLITSSRATFSAPDSGAMLLRAVSQLTIE